MSSIICTTYELKPSFPHIMEFSRNSNKAGSPLPSIPRRLSSSSSSSRGQIQLASDTSSLPSFSNSLPPTMLCVQPPTPPHEMRPSFPSPTRTTQRVAFPKDAESESSTSSSSTLSDGSRPTIVLRSKRVRGQRSPPRSPPEQSAPTPAPSPISDASKREKPDRIPFTESSNARQNGPVEDETQRVSRNLLRRGESSSKVRSLRLDLETPPTRHVSDSHVSALAESKSASKSAPLPGPAAIASAFLPPDARLIRKKSGEPIKSSLKSPKRRSLSVVTAGSSSKSEPSTPTQSKAVHFDAQLEHVKLFLAEQKPLAVSRDGSPTDTSGTDNDFPSFIFGHSSDEERTRKSLVMQVTNMPSKIQADADVALQELTLSKDSLSIHGRVRVKNIAFEKWLAIRFTFDWWQTTSEVTAKYVESIGSGGFDIFGFTIRLNDIMARIEDKALFLALRYTVAGREIWDNNGGENYLAKFSKSKVNPDDESTSSGSAITDLNSKLEQVARGRDSGSSFLAQRVHRQARLDAQKPSPLQNEKKLSARYDFSASLKNHSWKAGVTPSPPRHTRTSTYPSASPSTVPWPHKGSPIPSMSATLPPRSPRSSAMGSPSQDDSVLRVPVTAGGNAENVPFQVAHARNHRRGYFDRSVSVDSGFTPTSPGSPLVLSPLEETNSLTLPVPHIARFNSFPPREESGQQAVRVPNWAVSHDIITGGSAESTPSISSPTSSSQSSSPSPTELELTPTSDRVVPGTTSKSEGPENYSSFIDRFCFFTGGADPFLGVPTEEIPRSHSASSVEEFLYQQSPTGSFSPSSFPFGNPTRRSPSFDEIAHRSGATTPTGVIASESRSPTPIAG